MTHILALAFSLVLGAVARLSESVIEAWTARYPRMASIEGATNRLEQAVSRLERWARNRKEAGGIEDSRVAEALNEVRADYQALQETIQTVRARLDAAIERLQSIMER